MRQKMETGSIKPCFGVSWFMGMIVTAFKEENRDTEIRETRASMLSLSPVHFTYIPLIESKLVWKGR